DPLVVVDTCPPDCDLPPLACDVRMSACEPCRSVGELPMTFFGSAKMRSGGLASKDEIQITTVTTSKSVGTLILRTLIARQARNSRRRLKGECRRCQAHAH